MFKKVFLSSDGSLTENESYGCQNTLGVAPFGDTGLVQGPFPKSTKRPRCCPLSCGTDTDFGGASLTCDAGAMATGWTKVRKSPKPPEKDAIFRKAPLCEWPCLKSDDKGKCVEPFKPGYDPSIHMFRFAPCFGEQFPFCALVKIVASESKVQGFSRVVPAVGTAAIPRCWRPYPGGVCTNVTAGNIRCTFKKPCSGSPLEALFQQKFQPGFVGTKDVVASINELVGAADGLVRKAIAAVRFMKAGEFVNATIVHPDLPYKIPGCGCAQKEKLFSRRRTPCPSTESAPSELGAATASGGRRGGAMAGASFILSPSSSNRAGNDEALLGASDEIGGRRGGGGMSSQSSFSFAMGSNRAGNDESLQ